RAGREVRAPSRRRRGSLNDVDAELAVLAPVEQEPPVRVRSPVDGHLPALLGDRPDDRGLAGAAAPEVLLDDPHRSTCCAVSVNVIEWTAGSSSIPTQRRPWARAIRAVVPEPMNGSSTFPPGGHPATIIRRASSSGKTA